MFGADPEALEQEAKRLEIAAGGISSIDRHLTANLHAAPWRGRKADRYRANWDAIERQRLQAAATFLRDGARTLRQNAEEQRRASARESGSISGLRPKRQPPQIIRETRLDAFLESHGLKKQQGYELKSSSLPLFNGIPSAQDVKQGEAGDCYFAVGLASIAVADPSLIEKMITKNSDGTYTVTFHNPDGSMTAVTVDGNLYMNKYGNPAYGHGDNDQWFAIAEKAFAVYKGGYPATEGGCPTDVFSLVTGQPAHLGMVSDLSSRQVWDQVTKSIDGHTPAAAQTADYEGFRNGVHGDHAYSITGYETHGDQKIVVVRNPWGDHPSPNGEIKMPLDTFMKAFAILNWSE